MKKLFALLVCLVLALSLLAGCGSNEEENVLVVGASVTPHAEILEQCVAILAEQGIELQIVTYNDYVIPNTALEAGDIDANYFQHLPYLDSFNAENGTHLVSVAAVHYEPLGIYPGKCASLEDIAEGATIAVPNDGSNEARALQLLADNNLITLSEDFDISLGTILDIAENPLNLNIIEIEAAQLVLSLPDVDFAVINGNYAIGGGLNAAEDALAIEAKDSAGALYANILAVKEGNEEDPLVLALIDALQSETVKTFIEENYGGAVVAMF